MAPQVDDGRLIYDRGIGVESVGDALARRASRLKQSLSKLSKKRSSVDTVLSTLERRLESLEGSLVPVQEATSLLVVSHGNVVAAVKETELMLAHLDVVRAVESRIKRETLPTYCFSIPQVVDSVKDDQSNSSHQNESIDISDNAMKDSEGDDKSTRGIAGEENVDQEDDFQYVQKRISDFTLHVQKLRVASAHIKKYLQNSQSHDNNELENEDLIRIERLIDASTEKLIESFDVCCEQYNYLLVVWLQKHDFAQDDATVQNISESLEKLEKDDDRIAAVVSSLQCIVQTVVAVSKSQVNNVIEKLSGARLQVFKAISNQEILRLVQMTSSSSSSSQRLKAITSVDMAHLVKEWKIDLKIIFGFIVYENAFISKIVEEREYVENLIKNPIRRDIHSLNSKCFQQGIAQVVEMHMEFAIMLSKTDNVDKVFVVLDILNALEGMSDFLNSWSSKDTGKAIKKMVEACIQCMILSARQIFDDVKEEIKKDERRHDISADGAVHSMSSFVLSIMRRLSEYPDISLILYSEKNGEESKITSSRSTKDEKKIAQKKLVIDFLQVIASLQGSLFELSGISLEEDYSNLNTKAQPQISVTHAEKQALNCIFLINNIDYIETAVERLNFSKYISQNRQEKQKNVLERVTQKYLQICWSHIGNHLKESTLDCQNNAALNKRQRKTHKDAFKHFNSQILSICTRQSRWIIPSSDVREGLLSQIDDTILQPYEDYCSAALSAGFSKNHEKYIIYTKDSLQRLIHELFTAKAL